MTVDTSNFRALRRAAASVRSASDTVNLGASEEAKKRPKSGGARPKHEYSTLFRVLGLYRYYCREGTAWGGFRLPEGREAEWIGNALVAHEGLRRAKEILEAAEAAVNSGARAELELREKELKELLERARALTAQAGLRLAPEAVEAHINRHPKVVAAREAVKAAKRAVGPALDALAAARAGRHRAHARLREFTLGYAIVAAEAVLRREFRKQLRAGELAERERERNERRAKFLRRALAPATAALMEREAREALLAKHQHWEPADKRPLPNLGSEAPSRTRFVNAAKLAHIRRVSAERAARDWAWEQAQLHREAEEVLATL